MKATLTGPMKFIPAPDPTPKFIEGVWECNGEERHCILATEAIDSIGRLPDGTATVCFKDDMDLEVHYLSPTYEEFAELLVRRPEQWRQPMMVSYETEHNALGTDAGRDG